jgi:nucleotide-binding universal stress UspA family protein
MAIKDILVIVDLFGKRVAVDFAADLALKTSAHLTGLSTVFQPTMSGYAAAAVPADFMVAAVERAEADAADSAAAFQKVADRAGVNSDARTADLMAGAGFTEILKQTRVSDLVIVSQPDPDRPEPLRQSLIESILFEGGAPVLIVPYIATTKLKLDKALIAWDGSATAARAIHAALPVLALAKQVEVLIAGSANPEPDAGVDVAQYLARHGLKTELLRTPKGDIDVADILLNYVADRNFDWVVMGAYGHSRLREFVFGGATRDVLSEMTVPVLMTH